MKQENKSLQTGFVIYNILIVIVTTGVFAVYLILAAQNHFSEVGPMVSGTAARPYVYRVLTSFLIRVLATGTGLTLELSSVVVMYLSLLGFSFAMSSLARIFLRGKLSRWLILAAPIGLIPLLIEQRHIYDFPTLFLFTLGLYFLAKNRFLPYLITFAFTTLSKETSFFLIIFFLWHFRSMNRKQLIGLTLIQAAIYGGLRLATMLIFRNNPGGVMEFHWLDHIAAYEQNPIGALLFFGIIAGVIVLGLSRTADKTNFARDALFAIGIPTLVLFLPFGVPFEARVFLETYPAIFLIVGLAITRWTETRSAVRAQLNNPS